MLAETGPVAGKMKSLTVGTGGLGCGHPFSPGVDNHAKALEIGYVMVTILVLAGVVTIQWKVAMTVDAYV